MMTNSPVDNTEATFTSFSNPNYHFEDCINSNISHSQHYARNIYVDDTSDTLSTKSQTNGTKHRKTYAQMDLSAMGIPRNPDESLAPDDFQSPSSCDYRTFGADGASKASSYAEHDYDIKTVNKISDNEFPDSRKESKPRGFLGYYSQLEAKARERKDDLTSPDDALDVDIDDSQGEVTPSGSESTKPERYDENGLEINSPDSGIQSDTRSDDGVSHNPGSNDDLYAVVNKRRNINSPGSPVKSPVSSAEVPQDLPTGWQKHEDDLGAYYWHIKSGTIQRDLPTEEDGIKPSAVVNGDRLREPSSNPVPSGAGSSMDEHLQAFEGHALQYAAKSLQSLVTNSQEVDPHTPSSGKEKAVRYAVRSLGWVGIAEEDLTPERSSKAVNKCIIDLSLGRNDINDVVGRWGDGKDLFMDLDLDSLRLMDPQDSSFLNSQPIHSIRVWGVGRDNGRDFAYVARDKSTRRHMCHVFRCDMPARQIANTLRDICKRIMMETNMQEKTTMQRLSRPTDLPNLEKTSQPNGEKLSFQNLYSNASFPTPMEEPKKIIRCHYLGVLEVNKATGMDTLNNAIETMYRRVPPEKWIFANIAIAPSTICITEHGKPENKVDECRVRFLSFMGIAMKNVKMCAFIMHNAEDHYYAHVFHCEPSAGPLCKTIEAACKLRYQKCLDAHPQSPEVKRPVVSNTSKSLGASIKQGVQSVLGSITKSA